MPLAMERYRPMLRLLEQADLQFLRSQPGFRPAMLSRLRRQRCRIFQGYLCNLSRDFQYTCGALKVVILNSGQDRPDLAEALLRAQAAFAYGRLAVRCRLVLYRLGWSTVDVTGLLRLFDLVQLELQSRAGGAFPALA
jgi:hypothetical protein